MRSGRYLGARLILERGARREPVNREDVVRCQRNLIELNTLSHVFTRTRKREVQELFPTRRSATVSVTFTDAERVFYDAVTDWALETYAERAAHLVAATFQRLAASCLPALGQRLTDVVRSGVLAIGVDEATELAMRVWATAAPSTTRSPARMSTWSSRPRRSSDCWRRGMPTAAHVRQQVRRFRRSPHVVVRRRGRADPRLLLLHRDHRLSR